MAKCYPMVLILVLFACVLHQSWADVLRMNLHAMPILLGATVQDTEVDSCVAACPETSPDSDGDGLSDCAEQCVGTSVSVIDSDGDGMPDGFEHEYGLDPLVDDADADQDGDEYTNLDEFIGKSDPSHASSPHPVYFVSPDGADEVTGGTPSNPWRTVRFALENLTPASDGTAQLVLYEGGYDEDVALRPGITLAAARNATVIIAGRMIGAEATTLKRLTLAPGPETTYILDMNNVAMTLEQVTIEGDATRTHTGVLVDGTAPARSLFDRCVVRSLGVGIDIADAVPTMRRCLFEDFPESFGPDNLPGAAIFVRENGKDEPASRAIGDASDPANGWNDFLPSIEGFAVINERDEVIVMQDNYWGVTDTALFPTRVSGMADVLPILYHSSSVIASSFLCTIWDGNTQKRISSASVALNISPFDEVSDESDGVYAFPCIQDGEYNLVVDAAGYRQHTAPVTLRAGEVVSVSVALEAISEEGGEPHIDNLLPFFAGCSGVARGGGSGGGSAGADLFVLLLVLANLGLWQRRRNTSSRQTT